MRSALIWFAIMCACTGCTERKLQVPVGREAVMLATPPAPQHKLTTRFDDRVELLGYDLAPPELLSDKSFKIIWYWRVLAALPSGVRMFTHLADANGNVRLNLDASRALRELHPEASWRAGELLRDEQQVTLPAGWSSRELVFYLGFFGAGRRLPVTRGEHDDEQRFAVRLPVTVRRKLPKLPELEAQRLRTPLSLDGKLDEPAWIAAASSGPLVQTLAGTPGEFAATVRVLYDDQKLYVGFDVGDSLLKSSFEHDDDHLWEQDTVELMVDPDGDGRNYFELQVSPRGRHFDTRYDTRRNPRPFGHVDWDSQVEAKVGLHGALDDTAADSGYVIELAVPFSAFATATQPVAPPRPGSVWRMNFFVFDLGEQGQRSVGWSPPMRPDFHTLERFGRVRFN